MSGTDDAGYTCTVDIRQTRSDFSIDPRIVGANLFSHDEQTSNLIKQYGLTVDHERYTALDGYHLGKIIPFYL